MRIFAESSEELLVDLKVDLISKILLAHFEFFLLNLLSGVELIPLLAFLKDLL